MTFISTLVSFLFQAAGFICPGWIVTDLRKYGYSDESIGLWFEVVCDTRDVCHTISMFDKEGKIS